MDACLAMYVAGKRVHALARCYSLLQTIDYDGMHASSCRGKQCSCYEPLCLVVQLLVEEHQSEKVVPFLTSWYKNIKHAPPSIVSLVVLGFAHARLVEHAEALFQAWIAMRDWDDFHGSAAHKDLEGLVRHFFEYILLPAQRFTDAQRYLDTLAVVLTSEELVRLRSLSTPPPEGGGGERSNDLGEKATGMDGRRPYAQGLAASSGDGASALARFTSAVCVWSSRRCQALLRVILSVLRSHPQSSLMIVFILFVAAATRLRMRFKRV
jgi:hypothetical protein